MSRMSFVILGVAILCALPILGTFGESQGERTARLSTPSAVTTAPLTY